MMVLNFSQVVMVPSQCNAFRPIIRSDFLFLDF